MKKLITIILFSISLLISAGANADTRQMCEMSGASLAQCAADWEKVFQNGNVMENDSIVWNTASFQSFVDGVAFATSKKKWCSKSKNLISLDSLYAITAKFLREHPEEWQTPPADLVLIPIAQAFPCSKKAKK